MKKLLYAVLMVLIASSSYAAPSASTVWEIYGGATANNVNGCGFVTGATGSNYSLRTSDGGAGNDDMTAKYNGTDLLATAASSSALLSNATHTWDAADVGNIIHITAGTNWTAGWYEIVSVTSGTAILDRNATGAGWTNEQGTYYVGGACSMNSTLDDDFMDTFVAGNKVYVRSGSTVTIGENLTPGTAGTAANPILVYGYNSSRSTAATSTDRPYWNMQGFYWTGANYYIVENLRLNGTYASGPFTGGGFSLHKNVKVTCSTAGSCFTVSTSGRVVDCDFSNASTGVALNAGTTAVVIGNYIHDSQYGVTLGAGSLFDRNIVTGSTKTAVSPLTTATPFTIINNTIYGSATPTGVGIWQQNGSATGVVLNNIIYGFATGYLNASNDTQHGLVDWNMFYNNTANYSGLTAGINVAPNDTTAVDPTFDANYKLGNASAKGLAWPGAFQGLTTYYLDHGAAQSQATGGGLKTYAY